MKENIRNNFKEDLINREFSSKDMNVKKVPQNLINLINENELNNTYEYDSSDNELIELLGIQTENRNKNKRKIKLPLLK